MTAQASPNTPVATVPAQSSPAPAGMAMVPGGAQPPAAAPDNTPPPPATPQADAQWAAKFAAMTRKEQAAVKVLQEAKAKETAAAAKEAAAKAIEDKWNGYKGNPSKAMEALKELGYTYDQITQLYLNGGQVTPEMQIKQLEERINSESDQRRKDADDARNRSIEEAKASEQRAITQFRSQIDDHIVAEKAKYPLINHFGQAAQIWGLIEGHYDSTCTRDAEGNVVKAGQILAIPDAAKQVEEYIRDQVKKSQELLNPPPATPAPSEVAPPPKPAPAKIVSKPSTLTQSTTPVTTPKQQRNETDQERMARIVAKYSKKPA